MDGVLGAAAMMSNVSVEGSSDVGGTCRIYAAVVVHLSAHTTRHRRSGNFYYTAVCAFEHTSIAS